MLRRFLIAAAVLFAVYYVVTNPVGAAHLVGAISRAMHRAADALAKALSKR